MHHWRLQLSENKLGQLVNQQNEQSLEVRFIEVIRDSFLHQHITEHTRCRRTDIPSTIDLLFTDEADQVSNIEYLPSLGKSDHSTISFDFDTYTDITLSCTPNQILKP